MSQTNIRLKVNPEILQKLGASDEALWTVAHKDGSDNRVNWEDVADAVMSVFQFDTLDTKEA